MIKLKKMILIGVVVAAVIIISAISLLVYYSTSQIKSVESETKILGTDIITMDTPIKGDSSAPILLVEFGDFQCPNCGRFARETSPLIESNYIESGKVTMAFRHFTVVGPDSKIAAMASQCANDQGKFWEFHDELYRIQGHENSGWANNENMKKVAKKLGLDSNLFDSCLDGEKYQTLVENDLALALKLKLGGTPSFLILQNDGTEIQALTGAYPFAVFEKIFNENLGE